MKKILSFFILMFMVLFGGQVALSNVNASSEATLVEYESVWINDLSGFAADGGVLDRKSVV